MASRLEAERSVDAAMFLGPVEAVLAQTLDTEAKGGGVKRKEQSGKDEKEGSAPPPSFPDAKRRALELKAQSPEAKEEALTSVPGLFLSVLESRWSNITHTFERLATAFTVFTDSSLFGLPPMDIRLIKATDSINVGNFIRARGEINVFLFHAWRTELHVFPDIDWWVNTFEAIDNAMGHYRQPILNIRHLPIEDAGTPSRVSAVFKDHEEQYLAPCSLAGYVHSRSEGVFDVTVFHQADGRAAHPDAEAVQQYEELAVQAFAKKNKWPGRYFLELEQREVSFPRGGFSAVTRLQWMFTERCADHLARLMHDIAACSKSVKEFMAETQLPGYDGAQIVRGFLEDLRQRQAREPQMIARVPSSFRPQWHTELPEFARYWPVEFSIYFNDRPRKLTPGERETIQRTIEDIGMIWQRTYVGQVPRKRALRFYQRFLPNKEHTSLGADRVFKQVHSSNERKTLWRLMEGREDISTDFYADLVRPHYRLRPGSSESERVDDLQVSPEVHAQYQYWPTAIPGAKDMDEDNTKVWHIVFELNTEAIAWPIALHTWYDSTPQLAFYRSVSKTERLISVLVLDTRHTTQITQAELDPGQQFLAAKHLRIPSHTFAVMENGDNPVLGVCPAAIAALIRVDQEPIKELEKFAQETNMALDSELLIQSFLVGKFKA